MVKPNQRNRMAFYLEIFSLAALVYFSVMGLFYLDHKTQAFTQFMDLRFMPIVTIYFLPPFLISLALLVFMNKRAPSFKNLIIASAIGIPSGFALVIIAFSIF